MGYFDDSDSCYSPWIEIKQTFTHPVEPGTYPPLEDIFHLLVVSDDSKLELETKSIILMVDGLRHISRKFNDAQMQTTLSRLCDFAQQGFRIVCGISSTTSLVHCNLFGSSWRTMVILSYGPLRFSTVNDVSVFTITGVLERVLVEDCGGHSYALCQGASQVYRWTEYILGIDRQIRLRVRLSTGS